MTRVRLRSARLAEEESQYYGRVYPDGYKHDRWPDHVERINASVEMLKRYTSRFRTAADLSCGDGAVLCGIARDLEHVYLGDLNGVRTEPAWSALIRARGPLQAVQALPAGPLPDTLAYLPEPVDLFVLSETLEHLDDPDTLLRELTHAAQYLFISTPIDEPEGSGNLEHYWGWGTDDIHAMLTEAGWLPLEKRVLVPESTRALDGAYHYQLWLAVNR